MTNRFLKMNDSQRKILFILLCVVTIFFSIWTLHNHQTNEARIDNIISLLKSYTDRKYDEKSLASQLEIMKFHEDYFVDQLGTQSDWYIAYVSLLFVIFGFVGFEVFDGRFNRMKESTDKEFNEIREYVLDMQKDLQEVVNGVVHETKTFGDELTNQFNSLRTEFGSLKIQANRLQSDHLETLAAMFDNREQFALSFNHSFRSVSTDLSSMKFMSNEQRIELFQRSAKRLKFTLGRMHTIYQHPEQRWGFIDNLNFEHDMSILNPLLGVNDIEIKNTVRAIMNILESAKREKDERDTPN